VSRRKSWPAGLLATAPRHGSSPRLLNTALLHHGSSSPRLFFTTALLHHGYSSPRLLLYRSVAIIASRHRRGAAESQLIAQLFHDRHLNNASVAGRSSFTRLCRSSGAQKKSADSLCQLPRHCIIEPGRATRGEETLATGLEWAQPVGQTAASLCPGTEPPGRLLLAADHVPVFIRDSRHSGALLFVISLSLPPPSPPSYVQSQLYKRFQARAIFNDISLSPLYSLSRSTLPKICSNAPSNLRIYQ
jgi:hypothetical protein